MPSELCPHGIEFGYEFCAQCADEYEQAEIARMREGVAISDEGPWRRHEGDSPIEDNGVV